MLDRELTGSYPLSVERGRDIRAGHLRGWGIEFGKIIESTISVDPIWQKALAAATRRGTLLPPAKLANLYLILRYAIPQQGPVNVIEFGSFKGGAAVFFATLLQELGREGKVLALDTFEGMPKTDSTLDLHSEGDFKDCDFPGLINFVKTEGLSGRLELVKGRFEQTLPGILAGGTRFVLIHCDCDIYSGVKYVCQKADQLLVPGGHLVFDDPLYGSCLGAFTAVEEELIQTRRLHAEQVFPHLVYRIPALSSES